MLSRDRERLSGLRADQRWADLEQRLTGGRSWTDDFSNVLGALS